MKLLALETSCDDTSAAVIVEGRVRSNLISSQWTTHSVYGGVVPELATREHLRNWVPMARAALDGAGLLPADLDAVAATRGPGLPHALMIGFGAGKAVASILGKPFYGIHHHEAHLYSPWIDGGPDPRSRFDAMRPAIGLVVSGGHTLLVHIRSVGEHRVLGATVDDAAGECFDKVAKLIGLAYPGGPEIDRASRGGNPSRFAFPRPMKNDARDDFSFSGLKTAVRYFIRDNPSVLESGDSVSDLCASVQAAIVDVLVSKAIRAAKRLGVDSVAASGGVSRNHALRVELTDRCRIEGFDLRLAEPEFCTDNAAMIGILAEQKALAGTDPTPLNDEARPGWKLG